MSQEAVSPGAVGGGRRSRKLRSPQVRPGTEVGSYRVEARLGAGGFGTVFRAHRGGQRYALKLLSLEEVGEWGVREVLALSRVSHPHVVRLHGFWQWPEQAPRFHVVVMEYVEGRRLDVWTRTENPSALQVLRLLRGAAQALVAVHQARMVHRDVKLANLLVREADGEVMLVDFGVSGWEEASQVTGGMMPPGTLSYRSPEAWRFAREHAGKPGARYLATPADDVYALGCVLYWLLTDALPFSTEDGVDVDSVLGRVPDAPQVRNPRVPRELSELCLRLLEKRPEARPDAAAVCEAVEALLSRQGLEWEQALCEAFSLYNVSTDPEDSRAQEEQWARKAEDAPSRRLRRGRRPPYEVEERAPAVAESAPVAAEPPPPAPLVLPAPPAAPAPPLTASALPVEAASAGQAPLPPSVSPTGSALPDSPPARERTLRTQVRAGLVMGLVVALGVLVFSFSRDGEPPPAPEARADGPLAQSGLRTGSEFVLPTWEPGWKVAPPFEPPEAEREGPFAAEADSPASVASSVTAQHEDEASVKTPQQKKPRGLSAAKKAAIMGMTCATLACTGAPVRQSPPPPEPCPEGAVEAMEKLGIKVGDEAGATLTEEDPQLMPVNEGWIQLRTFQPFGKVRRRVFFSGRLIVRERVYGRLTQARIDGQTFPVCVELEDRDDFGRGLVREEKGGGTTATVDSTVTVEAVDAFR
jgi:serine/threonine protein kinase